MGFPREFPNIITANKEQIGLEISGLQIEYNTYLKQDSGYSSDIKT